MDGTAVLMRLDDLLSAVGLTRRGGFVPDAGDDAPDLADGRQPAAIVLLGNAGPAMWRAFTRSPEASLACNSLDRWTSRVVKAIAQDVAAEAIFPFAGPPFHPFMRWAKRAETVHPSPLHLLIHPVYGLWHAYRGALLFRRRLAPEGPDGARSPCVSCSTRPCLTACPVHAFAGGRFAVDACRTFVAGPPGEDCRTLGCVARRACPIGRAYHYEPEQSAFHMAAYAGFPEPGSTQPLESSG